MTEREIELAIARMVAEDADRRYRIEREADSRRAAAAVIEQELFA